MPLVQSRTEVDFPMTPRPMRVETASDGDFLTPDKKDIKERRLGRLVVLGVAGLGAGWFVWSWVIVVSDLLLGLG